MKSVLIVDDDVAFGSMVGEYLERHEMKFSMRHTGELGLEEAVSSQYDLMLLDVMLPDLDGFEVLRRLRTMSNLSVLLLSARGQPADRVHGLQLGADDYLPKPFDPDELVARIQAVLRRSSLQAQPASTGSDSRRILFHGLAVDPVTRTAWYKENVLDLTDIEFSLLEVFIRSRESPLTREDLVLKVFGRPFHPLNRNLDMHVSRLRKKLDSAQLPGNPIKTVRGIGYLFSVGRT